MVLLVTLCATLCFVVWLLHILKRRKDPPGPLGVPFFGTLFYQMYLGTNKMHRFFYFLHTSGKQYGPIWSFEIGQKKFIILHSYKAIRKAMMESGELFSGRPNSLLHLTISNTSGVASIDGDLWKIHRRFAISTLKNFGLGKQSLEPSVIAECDFIEGLISKKLDRSLISSEIFVKGIANIISVLVFGQRWAYDDKQFLDYVSHAHAITHASGIVAFLPIFYDFLSKPYVISRIPACFELITTCNKLRNIIKEKFVDHKNRFNQSEEAKDFIDALLIQQNVERESENTEQYFDDDKCIGDCFDLFIAGMDTTTTNLTWAMVMLSLYPQVQKKLQSEIDNIIGQERRPQMSDKKSMPYCQAVIDEVARFCTIAPHALDKRLMENIVFMGYEISTDALVLVNLYSVHHSEEIWDKPYDFNPDRFLDVQGNYKPSEYLISFGLGKRRCLGEGLAQMENFLFLTCLMQRFSVCLDEESMTRVDEVLAGTEGIIHSPGNHNIIFNRRD